MINLSPEKEKVFGEAYRVLKRGGRFAIADIVSIAPLPDVMKKDPALYTGCVSGAVKINELEFLLEKAGFTNIQINAIDKSRRIIREGISRENIGDYIASAMIEAVKP